MLNELFLGCAIRRNLGGNRAEGDVQGVGSAASTRPRGAGAHLCD